MTWEQIISPISVSGFLTLLGTVFAAIVAFISVKEYKEQKAYDLFTARRLQTYDHLLDVYREIMGITSIEYIDAATESSPKQYLADLGVALAKFSGTLSTTERQDGKLLEEYDALKDAIAAYIAAKSEKTLQALNEQRETVRYFTDVYLWALWRYYQRMHRKSSKQYHEFYDEQFEKVFERSKGLNESKTVFFTKYNAEDLTDPRAENGKSDRQDNRNQ